MWGGRIGNARHRFAATELGIVQILPPFINLLLADDSPLHEVLKDLGTREYASLLAMFPLDCERIQRLLILLMRAFLGLLESQAYETRHYQTERYQPPS